MNKSFITNLLASICVAAGLIFDQPVVLSVGLFALSGAVTNLLADQISILQLHKYLLVNWL
jgi:hypothetical protein